MINLKEDVHTRTTALYALIALLISTSGFKDELRHIILWEGSWTLLQVFVCAILMLSFILSLYLLIEWRQGTTFEGVFDQALFRLKRFLDTVLLLFIFAVVAFAIIVIILNAFAVPMVQRITAYVVVFVPLSIFSYLAVGGKIPRRRR